MFKGVDIIDNVIRNCFFKRKFDIWIKISCGVFSTKNSIGTEIILSMHAEK